MSRLIRLVAIVAIVLGLIPLGTASAQVTLPPNCLRIDLPSGEVYVICLPWTTPPASWDLVVFAHGYVAPNEPLDKFFEQLFLPDGTSLPALVTGIGYVFATTSYTKNGLAVKPGVDDVGRLVDFVAAQLHSSPAHVYVTGVSEGGLVTALAIEKHPERYSGALAACGPVGDFRRQVNYWGDFRVLYDYFFPASRYPAIQIPNSPIDINEALVWPNWNVISQGIAVAVSTDTSATRQLLKTSRAPIDLADPASVVSTTVGILVYNVFATNEGIVMLGGQPFDNRYRWYSGSNNDWLLNRSVARFTADPAALAEISRYYQTSGHLTKPLVTLHDTGDPIVPYWHETIYNAKVLFSGSLSKHLNIPIVRYGHCNFTAGEALASFALMVYMATGTLPPGAEKALPEAQWQSYHDLTKSYLPTLPDVIRR